MNDPLVYVMGPSGAGKDSVLDRARTMLSVEAPVAFAHRYITRPADIGGENHVALTAPSSPCAAPTACSPSIGTPTATTTASAARSTPGAPPASPWW